MEMKKPDLPADQQFFAEFSNLVINPYLLGRVWFANQPNSLPSSSLCIDLSQLDIVLRENMVINWKNAASADRRRNVVYYCPNGEPTG